MATDDAVSLLRTLKAAGEKTGAVEAEGALHLRRNSRRTMDGIHDTIGLLQASPSFNLPAAKYLSSASPTAPGGGGGGAASTLSSSSALLNLNYGNSILIPIASSPVHTTTTNGNGNGNNGNGGSLPVITSTASSPIASPARLSVRPPPTLTSLPSPTNSSPGGSGAAAAAAAGGSSGGPPSPPCLGPPHLNSVHTRRSLHTHSSNGSPYDALQLPYSHGSPLPLLFDPPVSLPPSAAAAAAAAPAASGVGVPLGVPGVAGGPGSPGTRLVQLSTSAAPPSPPSAASSSLPAIATVGSSSGGSGVGGGSSSPLSAPMPSLLLPSTSLRSVGGRNGPVGGLLVAAAGGSGSGSGSSSASPLKSQPAAGGSLSSGISSTPAGRLANPTTPRNGADLAPTASCSSSSSVPLPLAPGAAQAALQSQLAAAAAAAAAGQQRGGRPSSARSMAGSSFVMAVPEGLNGTAFKSAAKHDGHVVTSRPSVSSARGVSGAGPGGAVVIVGGSAASLPCVVHPRDSRSSDPGTCGPVTVTAAAAVPPGGTAAAPSGAAEFGFPTAAEPPLAGRQSLAPLTSAALQAVRANTPPASSPWPLNSPSSPPQLNLRAPRPEPLPQRPEPPPAQLPTAAAAAAAVAAAALPEPLQPRTESLPPLAEPLPSLAATGSVAAASGSVAGPLPLKAIPLGRAGTLAPLTFPEEVLTTAPGPVAESSLDPRTPDLDPAALFGPNPGSGFGAGSRSGSGFMELTVRSMAMKMASTGAASGAVAIGGEGFSVQSSVRQRLQTDPLRFHPPASAAGAVRRHSGGSTPYLDPLEATPRLVLGGASVGPPLRTGRALSSAAASGGGDALWAPSQNILPHLVSRVSGSGAVSGGNGSRLCFSPSSTAATPQPATPGFDLPASRLRSNSSGSGSSRIAEGGPPSKQTPSETLPPPPPLPRHSSQRAPGGLQSVYLQALAAAAGLDGSGDAAVPPLRRQRSLSESGCSAFLASSAAAAAAAAADSGFVGLPLEGGLSVLGDMMSLARAGRYHNVRYSSGLVDGFQPNNSTISDHSCKAATEIAAGGPQGFVRQYDDDDNDDNDGDVSSEQNDNRRHRHHERDAGAVLEVAMQASERGLASGSGSGGFGAEVSPGTGGAHFTHGPSCGNRLSPESVEVMLAWGS
ncbi:hypothetical protein VOLCADRAFT_95024 [Volvox carteri f. nagariensis]|uniref:Uncharacterized protein n=1 Tax=Volvox carteri f. nagariensis TaxID=3068 RepID=D8U6E4_VOLCA|nr:uncharacterized protein VOLCADRAFT_95024 [Volvox carteri f. nagariensis]EFJ44702.1 hypothetical protein VOLCADRAFT_95024 [Volvox carteri f. nagariensis]|eukprot:XP_002954278.1 hypothetical protein VOLCADRAFT_95024 [Volvox carteri f. nagariensis]